MPSHDRHADSDPYAGLPPYAARAALLRDIATGPVRRATFTITYGRDDPRPAIARDSWQRAMEVEVAVVCGKCPQRRVIARAWGLPDGGRPIVIGRYEVSAPLMTLAVDAALYRARFVCHRKCGADWVAVSEKLDAAFTCAAQRAEGARRRIVLLRDLDGLGVGVARTDEVVALRPIPDSRRGEYGPFRGPRG